MRSLLLFSFEYHILYVSIREKSVFNIAPNKSSQSWRSIYLCSDLKIRDHHIKQNNPDQDAESTLQKWMTVM
jgi:hypothetical protein